jgi:hypothetical protein
MKSKRKVFKHLEEVAYTKNAANRIMGFLLGCGIVEKGETVEFKTPEDGEIRCNFDDFYAWFENEEEELAVFGSLIEDLSDAQQEAFAEGDMETFNRVTEQLMLLLEDYGNDILEMEEEAEEEKENE